VEARHNNKLLSALQPWTQKLRESEDFSRLPSIFGPLMHVVTLIWLESPFFAEVTNFVVLLQTICNDVIHQVCRSFGVSGLLLTHARTFALPVP
jgi:dynein heavy chain